MAITAYHGSGVSIDQFDYGFTEMGNDQLGSGFYFSTSLPEAEGYCTARLDHKPKPGGMLNPTVHVASLDIRKPLAANAQITIRFDDVMKIIKASPDLDESLSNWGDIEFEGSEKLINEAANTYVSKEPVSAIKFLNMLSNDFFSGYPREFFEAVKAVYGFDGVVASFDHHKHYVAWFPEQITVTDRINLVDAMIDLAGPPQEDPEIRKGMMLYHGTSKNSAEDIIHNGIDFSKTSKGYFGNGFYCATDIKLSIASYAEMQDDDEEPAVVAMQLNPEYRILDLRAEADYEFWRDGKFETMCGRDDFDVIMRKNKIAGLYDRSFGGLVIYDKRAVSILGLADINRHKKKASISI